MTAARRMRVGAAAWRRIAFALPLLFAAATEARAADAIEQKDVEIAVVRDPQLGAQMAIADYYGYFKDEGLNVTIHWNQSGADIITVMAGGSAYLAAGSMFGQVLFSTQGLPIKTLAALADIAETQGFVLSPGVKLGNPRELEDKKIAFTQGSPSPLLLAKMANMFGFDMAKVRLVNMNQPEGIVAASKGDVQGLLGWQPFLYRLVTMGGTMYATGTTLYTGGAPQRLPDDDRLQMNHSLLMAAQSWIDGKPNTLKAVMRALLRADDLIAKDRPKALDALEKQLRIDRDALTVMVAANKYDLALDHNVAASLAFIGNWAVSINRAPRSATPEEAFAPDLLRALDPSLVSYAGNRAEK
ncbi:MAG: ABC transporter substrate-binding protein [Alphaproteobacteria bacterium]|nr:ABC transporter substrate-binding protein [Alphaproteobacteria bacterium]